MTFADLLALPVLFAVAATPVTPLVPTVVDVPWVTDVELTQPTGTCEVPTLYGPGC